VLAAADVGVASLGEHRRGSFTLSPLKTRDYLARGLPVLFAGDDPDLRSEPPFAWRGPDDDAAIEVAAVRAWLTSLRAADAASPASIRQWAFDRLDHRQRALQILDALGLAPPVADVRRRADQRPDGHGLPASPRSAAPEKLRV
jgi:hypothetical protein